uniref:Uncharacterized protein n=1 Tax=Ascaris lumbricoides TaxID=6252 RepID=A0A0M3HGI3_ASCLU
MRTTITRCAMQESTSHVNGFESFSDSSLSLHQSSHILRLEADCCVDMK